MHKIPIGISSCLLGQHVRFDAGHKRDPYIERYRRGEFALCVPITLLKQHFRKTPDPYIEKSYYMSPYPQELQIINQL